jgi:hypothetical protein
MSACPLLIRLLPWSRVALLALLLIAARTAHTQMLDLNTNGISDVWETLYGAQGCDPDQDFDGDGVPNRLEAVAGTDPFDAGSVPRISRFTVTTNGIQVSMAGALGKCYQLQGSDVICSSTATNWRTETSMVARTNPMVTLTAAGDLRSRSRFFRMVVSDVDTDGDGLNDWEEYQLGLDPLSATSNGKVDRNGKRMSDYQYVTNRLASQGLASLIVGSLKHQPATAHAAVRGPAKAGILLSASSISAGTGLSGKYFTNSSTVYTNVANFNPTNLFLTTNDPVINISGGPGTTRDLGNLVCSVRWAGQVQPQYSETYTFGTRSQDGAKLWVNDQLLIDKWQRQGVTSWANTIALQAGVRYDIRMEYFNQGGGALAQLFWYSPSQAYQLIPAKQLYPASDGLAPGVVTSPLNAVAFLGGPFSYTIIAANSPLGYVVTNLPPGLVFNSSNSVISGIPTLAGNFPISITVSNAVGTTTNLLNLEVLDTGNSVTREVWLGVPGTSITNIPIHRPASLTNALGNLEGILNFGDNYGERIRGYLTAPVTGNYYFWIAANNTAELWISNDGEPANKVRRAYVSKGTAPHQWNLQPTQRSPWLALVAGKRYYIEILHKAGPGLNDHWSVGWLQDPIGTNKVPAEVVPGYVLSGYTPTPISQIPGTLYTANMLALPGVASTAIGSATLRVSADGSQATLNFQISNLSSPPSSEHIDSDPYLSNPSQLIFDISAVSPGPDGSYVWSIAPVGTLSTADILEIISEGKATINIHSATYPAGEISGHFTLANGSQIFTPPPLPPVWKDDHSNSNAAARFLLQSTFGPRPADILSVRSLGYAGWINNQFKLRVSGHLTNVLALAGGDPNALYSSSLTFNTWWQQSVTAPDQLRQRVAFALSEIMVVSENGVLGNDAPALSSYYDLLLTNAFGNFRNLLRAVTLSPAMGIYLDMRDNDKGNSLLGTHPNENYAREVMQLFSIGLNRMWPDGTLVLNSNGNLVPTYDQDVIIGYARVFTGWNYYQTNQSYKRLPTNWYPPGNYTNAMVLVPTHHELGSKLLLDNAVLPAAQGSQADPASTNFDAYCSQDLERALDSIFYNENVGPFICRQLIQRLVTSHPSRDYLYRVVQVFDNNGSGVRGDMKAVIKAILLDYEARSPALLVEPTYGKQREPLLRATAVARAFPAPPALQGIYRQNGSQVITVTTSRPHRLGSSDSVFLSFTGNPAPSSQIYNRVGVSNATTFNIIAPGVSVGTYNQSGTTITVTNSGHGLSAGYQVYLTFTSGGAPNGIYTVATVPSSSVFTVTASSSATRSGSCLFPKWTGGSFVQSGTTISFTTTSPHGLSIGKNAYIAFPAGTPSPNGIYRVAGVPAPTRFTVISTVSTNWNNNNPLVLPLAAAPLVRSGRVAVRYNTWNMNYTDSGFSSSLSQTPLDSPTVFNFFFPGYKFQGVLASAGLTTPEFQLTSDTSVVLQMNFLSSSIFNNSSNTNGLSSFTGGSGAIALDLGPWMTPAHTSDAGIPGLVDALNTLLCAGQLSPAARTIIVNYVANTSNFPYTTPPTATQMRDRVRAMAHMIVASPDFTIQR